jgi:hypothetical protein
MVSNSWPDGRKIKEEKHRIQEVLNTKWLRPGAGKTLGLRAKQTDIELASTSLPAKLDQQWHSRTEKGEASGTQNLQRESREPCANRGTPGKTGSEPKRKKNEGGINCFAAAVATPIVTFQL